MTEIEEPDPRWWAIIGDGVDAVVETVGAKGYTLMAALTALVAFHSYHTGAAPGLWGRVMGVEVYLFILGVLVGGCMMFAANLYGEGGETS